MTVVPAQKRKRDDTAAPPEVVGKKRHLGSFLRESIALATASDMDDASLDPLLDNLSSALHLSCTLSTTEWNWTMDAKTVLGMDAGDRLVLAEMVGSRAQLDRAGILVKPQNWNVTGEPVEWIVHLPDLPLVNPLGRAVFTVTIHFPATPGELKPKDVFPTKIRSVVPASARFAALVRGADPAQSEAYTCFRKEPQVYYERIRAQTVAWTPDPVTGLAGRPALKSRDRAQ